MSSAKKPPVILFKYVCISICLLISYNSRAQVNNLFLYDPITFNAGDSGRIGFSVINNNYLRNTEYYNNIEVGRTLFGYQLIPSLYYQVNSHIKLQGGLFVRKDFGGDEPYTTVTPTFTLKLKNNNWQILFGTLEGSINHRMVEPMFDIAAYIEKHMENGFQLKHVSDKFFFDTWINWEKFIERGATEKEMLTTGLNLQPKITVTINQFSVTPIIQGMLSHRGGQIDKDSISFYVIANYAAGIRFMKQNNTGFISEWRFEPYLLRYSLNDGNIYPFKEGNAIYINATVKAKNLSVMFSYWEGNSYIAPKGSPIYSSLSLDRPGHIEPNRHLLFIRLFYEKKVFEHISMSARFEPVYDLKNSLLDYSYSLYLTYRGNWNFGKK
ncbi:MAG: hypothetical protein H7296_08115 [Bacteroidia bacterium]|nr:hypothetical protein [Bacteroidia bacterium]